MELYKKHRPNKLQKVIGQDDSTNILHTFVKKRKVPHALLFSGPSGCGKTTLARIMRKELKCGKNDFNELDCADFRGIEMVRSIRSRLMQAPIDGECRVWLIDECHKLTTDAQDAFLKILEDTPKHVYFMLATTDPQKLKRTIRTRCTEVSVKPLASNDLNKLLLGVCKKEGVEIPKKVIKKIIDYCEGSARKALVFLNQIIDLADKDMEDAIKESTMETQAILIARALLNPSTRWPKMASILKENQKEDPEGIRWMVLGYAKTVMLSGKLSAQCYLILDSFRDHFYDSKFAGLIAACYEVVEKNRD